MTEKLIGLERLTDLIETVIWSGALANAIPLSILIIGESGTGKSKTVLSFNCKSLHVTNDMTSSGLFEAMQRDRDNKIRHILFPDMNAILAHKASTSELFFGNLLALMSEGITRIDDGRNVKEIPHLPVGLIAAATPGMYDANSRKWEKTGLKRRFLPIFFDYSTQTRQDVNAAIRNGEVTLKQLSKKSVDLPGRLIGNVSIGEVESFQIENLSRILADHLGWRASRTRNPDTKIWFVHPAPGKTPIEFTPHLVLRTLASAHAARARRASIDEDDIHFVTQAIDFCKYGSPVQL